LVKKLGQFNPALSFPTVIIDERDTILGFDEDKIRNKFK